MTATVVSFIIVNYFVADKVAAAVQSIYDHCPVPFEVLVADNSASDEELARLQASVGDRVTLLPLGYNAGFGTACNAAARRATGTYLLFLNPDARLLHDSVTQMIEDMERDPQLGALGGRLIDERGIEVHSAGRYPGLRTSLGDGKQLLVEAWQRLRPNARARHTPAAAPPPEGALDRVDYVMGADLMMRSEDFRRLGGFDESFFLYVEENELQYRLRQELGKYAAVDRRVEFFHEIGGTPNASPNWRRCLVHEGRLRFVRKHNSPAYQAAYRVVTLQLALAHVVLGRWVGKYTLREDCDLLQTVLRGASTPDPPRAREEPASSPDPVRSEGRDR